MSSTLNNLFWKYAERFSSQLVSFGVSIILARLLEPQDYGAVSMVTIFVTLATVLVEGGFSSSLIQKTDADKLDFSTVFYFSLAFSFALYFILFFAAPYISSFYGEEYEILTPVLRVVGLQIIVYGANSVQQAYVSKHMMFRKFFWATLIGTIVSACVGIVMAYCGCGIWALVWQQLTMSITNTLVLYAVTKKLPGLIFSFERLKRLFNYGAKILGSQLLITLFTNLRSLVIGKLYTAKDLAFFDKGGQLSGLVMININASLGAVLFPKMSKEQDNRVRIKQICRNSIRFSSFVMMPIMTGLAVCAGPLVRLLLTEKWMGCVPYLQLFCITYMFYPLHTANMQAIKAIGYSGTVFKLELVKKSIELTCLFIVMKISIMSIAINMAVLASLFTIVNAYPNTKLLNYSLKEQLKDVLPFISMSSVMALCVHLAGKIPVSDFWVLIIQISIGVIVYVSLSLIIKNSEMMYLIQVIKSKLNLK